MKALALVEAPDHVCSRYRVAAFEPALASRGVTLTMEGLARSPLARWRQCVRASAFDAVLLQRKLLPAWQLSLLRRHSRRLLFDLDDAVFLRDSYHPRGLCSRGRLARFQRTVHAADAVLAGNEFLADYARESGGEHDRVHVIPTCVEPSIYQPRSKRADRTGLDLVWIGSSSTLQGLEMRRSLWERLAVEVSGLRMRVLSDRFPTLGAMPVVPITWRRETEADEVAAGDVGISWVPDDDWSRGKCGLKVLQYMAAGLPVVANPVGVHAEMIEHGVTGFLAETDDEWVAAIRRLASNPALRRSMGAAARARLTARYSVEAWSGAFVSALMGESAKASARGRRIRGRSTARAAAGDP